MISIDDFERDFVMQYFRSVQAQDKRMKDLKRIAAIALQVMKPIRMAHMQQRSMSGRSYFTPPEQNGIIDGSFASAQQLSKTHLIVRRITPPLQEGIVPRQTGRE